MSSNLPEFNVSLNRFLERTKVDADTAVRSITFEAFRRIVKRTPVDTGALRASWQISTAAPPDPVTRPGAAPGPKDTSKVTIATGAWIANPLVYALVVEFGLYQPPDPGPSKDIRPDRTGRLGPRPP